MPIPSRRIRRAVLASLAASGAGLGAIVAAGVAAPAGDQPDLVPLLPGDSAGAPNARWVDTQEVPGRTLFRFDSVILNQGAGAFEVYRDAAGTTFQRTWSGGHPAAAGTSKAFPAGTGSGDRPIGLGGPGQQNALRYSAALGHDHFHAQRIAGYELRTTAGARVMASAKNLAGFCLFDSWGDDATPSYYPTDGTSCARGEANYAGFLRMGISPGWGDLYNSQLWDQWVDVTDVAPGNYRLVATVDPDGLYEESNESNNVSAPVDVVIPGVTATPRSVATAPGQAVDIPLAGTVVGAGVKSRKTKDCDAGQPACMTTAAAGVASFAVSGASKGTAALSGTRVRYTPPAGFLGTATFTYTATDSRGLTSRPATVSVEVTRSGVANAGNRLRPGAVSLKVTQLRGRNGFVRLRAAGVVAPGRSGVRTCAGRVRLRVVAGRTVVRTVTAVVRRRTGACRFRVTLAVPRAKVRTGPVKVAARYLGSAKLLPRNGPVRTVRLR